MGLTQITTGGVDDNINIDSNTLKVDGTNNRVGIGTSSPGFKLEVNSGTSDSVALFESSDTTARIILRDNGSTSGGYVGVATEDMFFHTNGTERLRIDSSGRVGIGTSSPANTLHVDKDTGSTPTVYINNSGSSSGDGVALKVQASQRGTGVADASVFSVHNNASEIFTVRNDGNVGIGTSSPAAKLHVENGDVRLEKDTKVTIGFRGHTSGSTALAFRDANAAVDRMTIDSSGNVGIQQSSPSFPLQVETSATGTTSGSNGVILVQSKASGRDAHIRFGDNVNATARVGYLSNSLYAWVNGAERLRIDSSGRVGIGTTSPGVVGVHVRNSSEVFLRLDHSGTNTWDISNDSNLKFARGGTERMRIDSNGRLLVGTSSSISAGSSAGAMLQVEHESGSVSGAFYCTADTAQGGTLVLGHGRGSATGVLQNGDTLGDIRFAGADGTDFQTQGARIQANVDGTPGSNDMPTRLAFLTCSDGQSSPTERMRIGNAGHIGFGGEFDLSASNRVSINPADGLIGLGMDGRESYVTGLSGCYIYSGSGATGTTKAGEVIIQSRSNVNRDITFVTGTTPAKRLSVYGSGSVQVHGAFSKGSGSFKIDHPLPAKTATHNLVHSFIEGPQADLIYRGKVDLTAGAATVNLDTAARMTEGTFVLLNTNVQCFTSNESDWTAVRGSVSGNTLTIAAEDNTSTATVSWLVIGERQDQHMLDTDWTDDNGRVITEPEKPS